MKFYSQWTYHAKKRVKQTGIWWKNAISELTLKKILNCVLEEEKLSQKGQKCKRHEE